MLWIILSMRWNSVRRDGNFGLNPLCEKDTGRPDSPAKPVTGSSFAIGVFNTQ